MQNIKLLFFLAVWKRPEITEICFMGLDRLRRESGFDCQSLAVISEESMIPLCEKWGINWCFHDNEPLSAKKNFGIEQAKKLDFDYLVELGSDDLIKTELLQLYRPHMESGVSMLGTNWFGFINTKTGEARVFQKGIFATFGVGRAFHRSVIEKHSPLWPEKLNKGLDNASHFALARKGVFSKKVMVNKPLAVDLKSDVNIWSFDSIQGGNISFDEAVEGLSAEEINAIKALQWQNVKS